ncbi:MAG TPA: hypothetical protein VGQ31_04040 [Candidatus Limnocylindrales bacterium]|jgi:hypothetical protein|nr:hypothetical protein [Candidatus Limnocylindrales bacterium]
MSSDPDRVAVPTNGRRPHPVPASDATAATAADDRTAAASPALPGGLSAQQLMVGFGIVASLVAIAAGLARRRVRR